MSPTYFAQEATVLNQIAHVYTMEGVGGKYGFYIKSQKDDYQENPMPR